MIYFTSDTHFGDDRLNLYGRDLVCKDSKEMDQLIIDNWNSVVTPDDTVYHLGDVAMSEEALRENLPKLNGKKILIKGNYDDKISDDILNEYFDEVYKNYKLQHQELDGRKTFFFMNHYPAKGDDMMMNLVGHIHGLWKVQRNMINVGCDAWHFKPISIDQIMFSKNGIEKYYDENVFAGELLCNLKYVKK